MPNESNGAVRREKSANRASLPTLLLVAATLIWGATFVVVDEAIASYRFQNFLAARFLLATLGLLPLALFQMTRRAFLVGSLLGLPVALGYFLQTWGLEYAPPTNSGLITGSVVLWAPLLDRLLFRKPMRLRTGAFAAAAILGLALMSGASPAAVRFGDALTLGCAAAFALHLSLTSRFAPGSGALPLTFAQMLSCALLFSAQALFSGKPALPPPSVWPALLITGLGASGICYLILTYAQKRISSARTAMLLTLESAFALLFGVWWGGDRLSTLQWTGAATLLASIAGHEAAALFATQSDAEPAPESRRRSPTRSPDRQK